MNVTDSGPITNGYQCVFDFTTSQANGTISALALTSAYGGKYYYGNRYGFAESIYLLGSSSMYKSQSTDGDEVYYTFANHRINAVEVNFEEKYYVSILWDIPNTTFTIRKLKCGFANLNLNSNFYNCTLEEEGMIEEHTITPSTFTSIYGGFFDGKDGYWYGFDTKTSRTVSWIKISKEDYTFEEGTWSFGTEVPVFYTTTYLNTSSTYISAESRYVYRVNHSTFANFIDGYFYVYTSDFTKIAKINFSNPADVTLIALPTTVTPYDNYGTMPIHYMQYINGCLYGWGYRYNIATSEVIALPVPLNRTTELSFINNVRVATPLFPCGTKLIAFGNANNNGILYTSIFSNFPYMATINNLESPVTKTADKTMKITYTLTYVEE